MRASIHSASWASPYRNDFSQFLRCAGWKVTQGFVIEDTQHFERTCRRLAAAGITEASAEPITDATGR